MSGEMPSKTAELTPETFNTCYQVLAQAIRDEEPLVRYTTKPGFPPSENEIEAQESQIATATGPLDTWLAYALDGDLGQVTPGPDGVTMPWHYMKAKRENNLDDHAGTLTTITQNLSSAWTGIAAGDCAEYLTSMSGELQDFVGATSDSGYMLATGKLVEASFAQQAAFKQDLLSLAIGAKEAIDGMEEGDPWAEIGLIVLAVAGLALTAVSAGLAAGAVAVSAGAKIVQAVFTEGVAPTVGGYVFEFGTNEVVKRTIEGSSVQDIMAQFDGHLAELVASHQAAASRLATEMQSLLDSMDSMTMPKGLPTVPGVTAEGITPLTAAEFLPRSIEDEPAYSDGINNLPAPDFQPADGPNSETEPASESSAETPWEQAPV